MNDETPGDAPHEGDDPHRRDFLATTSNVAMAGGLLVSYGTFFYMAGRFLYPAAPQPKAWLFVAPVAEIAPGNSLTMIDPTGASVVIARRERTPEEEEKEPSVDEFIALSSVCPHLGCRVHWEALNNRFFCPCHNGVFDPEGNATEGPPAATSPPQTLSRYPLKIDGGNLMIEVPTESVGVGQRAAVSNSQRQVEEA
ncbi:MAG: Rieske (2Fe-2S) protein [Planctomycetes bacterium]|nr:Rieske (2Fe-2S) protein [Planctomycetota bacterium]